MHVIDLDNWPRRDHFQLYNKMEFPHFIFTVQLDITDLWTNRSLSITSPTITLLYSITRAANRLPEFKQRIHGDQIVEYDLIHPLVTILGEDDLFGVTTLTYDEQFPAFAVMAEEQVAKASESVSMDEFPHDQEREITRDDLLSITILPWLAFTSFSITRKPQQDCIPLLAFGRVQAFGDRFLMPFYVNFHHALADGLHAARFVKFIEDEAGALADSIE